MSKESVLASQIMQNIGGLENVQAMEHCATRLRIILKDDSLFNQEKIEEIDGVKGYFLQTGQHQIILGSGLVNKVYDEINFSGATVKEKAYENMNILQKTIRILADVFIPIIPVIVAAGLFMGLRNTFGTDLPEELLLLTQVLTDTAFIFLPALVVWSVFKRLGGSESVGIVIGLMTVASQIPNAYAVGAGSAEPLSVFGFSIMGFQGMVLPALVTGVLGAKLEGWIKKWMPNSLQLVFTPFLTITITIFVALFAIGPVIGAVQNFIMHNIQAVINLPYGIGGLIFAPLYQILVIMGLHHSFTIIEINNIAMYNANILNPIYSATGASMIGVGVAAFLKMKTAKERGVVTSSILSTAFGIGEPLLYGVVLKDPKLMIANLIGGAVGGCFVTLVGLAPNIMGVTLLPAIPAYIGQGIGLYLATLAIAFVTAFIAANVLTAKK